MGADLTIKWIKTDEVRQFNWSKEGIEHMPFSELDDFYGGEGCFPNKEWMVDTLLTLLKVPVLKAFSKSDCRTVYCLDHKEAIRFVNEIKRLAVLSIEREDKNAKEELNSIFGKDFCKYYEHVPEELCYILVEAKIVRDVLAEHKDMSCVLEVWY